MQEAVEPLTIVRARPLGGLRMVDKGGDDKIVAVCIDDPAYDTLSITLQDQGAGPESSRRVVLVGALDDE